ncbi:hypothetical protein [Nonomuraea basaltis]|uniref:hypothetical protein n=1 Tax=Nonomuraea basaltis TaxID=2495887 RepID=UPI003B848044
MHPDEAHDLLQRGAGQATRLHATTVPVPVPVSVPRHHRIEVDLHQPRAANLAALMPGVTRSGCVAPRGAVLPAHRRSRPGPSHAADPSRDDEEPARTHRAVLCAHQQQPGHSSSPGSRRCRRQCGCARRPSIPRTCAWSWSCVR